MLQDLAASTAALIGVAQLLVPAISFFKDMWPHTAAFDRNLLVIAVYTVCSALVVVWTLVPSLFSITHGAAWHFVPFIFRIHILVLIMATNFSAIVLSNARRCLQSRLRGTASGSVVPVNA